MKASFFPKIASFAIASIGLAMVQVTAMAATGNAPAAPNVSENALNRYPPKPPVPARFNEDGTPANDAALGIRPEPPVQLPAKAANRPIAHHPVVRGPVDLTKPTTESRPQREITIKR